MVSTPKIERVGELCEQVRKMGKYPVLVEQALSVERKNSLPLPQPPGLLQCPSRGLFSSIMPFGPNLEARLRKG